MANLQDVVDGLTDLRVELAQLIAANQQIIQAVQNQTRGQSRGVGPNRPQNQKDFKERLKNRIKNQTERSVAIKAGRALVAPGEKILQAGEAGLRAAIQGIGTGSSFAARFSRGVVQSFAGSIIDVGGALQRGQDTLARAQSSVGATNEAIVRSGGKLSGQAIDFQNRVALIQERRVQAFRDTQNARFTELSRGESAFTVSRTAGEERSFSSGLGLAEATAALERLAAGAEKATDALSPKSVH